MNDKINLNIFFSAVLPPLPKTKHLNVGLSIDSIPFHSIDLNILVQIPYCVNYCNFNF